MEHRLNKWIKLKRYIGTQILKTITKENISPGVRKKTLNGVNSMETMRNAWPKTSRSKNVMSLFESSK